MATGDTVDAVILGPSIRRACGPAVLALAASCSTPHEAASTSEPMPSTAAVRDIDATPRHEASAAIASTAKPAAPKWEPRADDPRAPEHALEFPEALTGFYDQLARIDDGEKQVARVVHLGASAIGLDDLTSILREKFQRRFGDGGAGMVLMQRYMSNYVHKWVKFEGKAWKHCYIAYLCKKDGHYGLGGVSFESNPGARTTISTRKHELGDEVSRIHVFYAAVPGGGKLAVRVDDGAPQMLDARAGALEDRFHELQVARGPHEIEVRATGGPVRAYGVVLETDGPGVVWDQFSMLGAFTSRLLAWNERHIADQIAHRDPHLIVFTYGGNDLRRVIVGKLDREGYAREYRKAIERVRAGKPLASCLVIGTSDRSRTLTFEVRHSDVTTIVEAQRQAAREAGCAFFDSYQAMGGEGSARRWRRMDPPLLAPDLKHLTHAGNEILGQWVYEAIVAEYVRHRSAPPQD